jgi:hypothetical protein
VAYEACAVWIASALARLRAAVRFLLRCKDRGPSYRPWRRTVPDFSHPPIDSELCLRIGQIVTRWSAVEYLIALLLGTFLNADQGGMTIITNNVAAALQTKWLRALMASHDHEAHHNERVNELLIRADELRGERNEFVHGIWSQTGCEPHTALVETVNLDRSEIIKSRLVTLHDLDEHISEIDRWIADYVALGRELGFPRQRGQDRSMFAD